jgi:hypothetical protein
MLTVFHELLDKYGVIFSKCEELIEFLSLPKPDLRRAVVLIGDIDWKVRSEYDKKPLPKVILRKFEQTDQILWEKGFFKIFEKFEKWPK